MRTTKEYMLGNKFIELIENGKFGIDMCQLTLTALLESIYVVFTTKYKLIEPHIARYCIIKSLTYWNFNKSHNRIIGKWADSGLHNIIDNMIGDRVKNEKIYA
jgi:hypothetical protein